MRNKDWINKLERKYGSYAIPNLMKYIVLGMAIIYIFDYALAPAMRLNLTYSLAFIRNKIFAGQIWRLISFIFIPPQASPLFILLSLYFYWLIGESLEQYWGSFRFTLYYLCGVLGTIVAGFISGYATNHYLNLTLFFAFTVLNPEFEVLLFFVLPVKMKWLGALSGISLLISFFSTGLSGKLSIIAALGNFFLFFGQDFMDMANNIYRRYKWKRDTK